MTNNLPALPVLLAYLNGGVIYCPARPIEPDWELWDGRRWPDMHTAAERWTVTAYDLVTEQAHPTIQQQTPPAIYDACLLLAPTWAGTLTEMVGAAKLLAAP